MYGCCDRRKYVLHGFKEAGRIRLVDADAGADIGSLCADVPAHNDPMSAPASDHYAQMCLRVADNGIGMSKEFRNSSHPLAKKIPILAMTAKAFSEDVQNAFNAGMNAHIVKLVDMKVLIKTVWNLQTGAGAAGTLN